MFLITTAEQRFWKTDEPVLFLGEWCRLFSQRHVWENLTYEVLPYHWDDRKKLYRDYLYLDKLYNKTILHMADQLNSIHSVRYSLRYWRIVIGPWLCWFIHVLYDRYQTILLAIESGKISNTLISKYDEVKWLPQDFLSFVNYAMDNDLYNHYIYSLIIQTTGKMPFDIFETTVEETFQEKPKEVKNPFVPKRILRKMLYIYGKVANAKFNKVIFISSYFSILNLLKIQLLLKQTPYPYPPAVKLPEARINLNTRDQLHFEAPNNDFEQLLHVMIRKQIPSIYVESYAEVNEGALAAYPEKVRVIVTANAYYFNEAFKLWAGYHGDHGAKLVGTQHGGLYGAALWLSTEKHEIKVSDKFFTWGWKSDTSENTKKLAASKLLDVNKSIRQKKDGRILLVLMTLPRYSCLMGSMPVASSSVLSYIDDQFTFVSMLSEENQKLLLVRLYYADHGWNQVERWNSKFPEIECYQGAKTMPNQLRESRLFIGTYNATTYLETLAANFPSVIFWNPEHWELRSSAQPYFDELRRVGIFYDTPEAAAEKINEISHDPASWWKQPEIQRAKDKFCFQFARTSNNWMNEWKQELQG